MTKKEYNYLREKERLCGLDKEERFLLTFEELEDEF